MKSASLAVLVSVALAGVLGCTTSKQATSPTAPADPLSGSPPGSSACTFTITEVPGSFNASGGSAFATISTQPNCRWTASGGGSTWIDVDRLQTFAGSATIPLAIEPNRSFSERSGAIEIQGEGGRA